LLTRVSYTQHHQISYTREEDAWPGNPYWRGKLSTVDLHIKIGCLYEKEKCGFSMESSWSERVRTRRSAVL